MKIIKLGNITLINQLKDSILLVGTFNNQLISIINNIIDEHITDENTKKRFRTNLWYYLSKWEKASQRGEAFPNRDQLDWIIRTSLS